MLISFDTIQWFCQEVVDKFQPERIILLGSYAYGEPTQGSDIDLLVFCPLIVIQRRKRLKSSSPSTIISR